MEIEGRRVLITGASRGIGRGLARGFARAGAHVALVARSREPLEALAKELDGRAFPADLSDPGVVNGLIDHIEQDAGPIDVLVNNAGLSHIDYFLSQSTEQIEELFRTNLLTPVHLCHQLIPHLLERGGGHIVNLSSVAGVMAPPGLVHYGATKAALSHYTAGLRMDLKGLPIGTTLVELGSVATGLDDQTQEYPPFLALRRGRARKDATKDGRVTVDAVVTAVVNAVLRNRRHVRLPRSLAPLAAVTESPRRLMELLFRRIETRPS